MSGGGGPLLGRWRAIGWGGAIILLLIPAVAMQVSNDVQWGAEDFVAAFLLLALAGVGIEIIVRMARSPVARMVGIAVVIGALLFIWAALAVGIFH